MDPRWRTRHKRGMNGNQRYLDEEYGIEMIAPNRENRGKTQDGRALRRYMRRWVLERLVAWLHRSPSWLSATNFMLRTSSAWSGLAE